MKAVHQIIEIHGGFTALHKQSIRIENGGYMPLTIEAIGLGPRGYPKVSVCHYYEQNGDLCQDPEMTFEVNPDNKAWHPLEFQSAKIGWYQVCCWTDDSGEIWIKPKLIRQLKSFARMWSGNIRNQGFIKVAKSLRKGAKTA